MVKRGARRAKQEKKSSNIAATIPQRKEVFSHHKLNIAILSIMLGIAVVFLLLNDEYSQITGKATEPNIPGAEPTSVPLSEPSDIPTNLKEECKSCELLCGTVHGYSGEAFENCLNNERAKVENVVVEAKPEIREFKIYQFWVFQFDLDKGYIGKLKNVLPADEFQKANFRVAPQRTVLALCIFSSPTNADCRAGDLNILPNNAEGAKHKIRFSARFYEKKKSVLVSGPQKCTDANPPEFSKFLVNDLSGYSPSRRPYCTGKGSADSLFVEPRSTLTAEAPKSYLTPPRDASGTMTLPITYSNKEKNAEGNLVAKLDWIAAKYPEYGTFLEFDTKEEVRAYQNGKYADWLKLFDSIPEEQRSPEEVAQRSSDTARGAIANAKGFVDRTADKIGTAGALMACPASLAGSLVNPIGIFGAASTCTTAVVKGAKAIGGFFRGRAKETAPTTPATGEETGETVAKQSGKRKGLLRQIGGAIYDAGHRLVTGKDPGERKLIIPEEELSQEIKDCVDAATVISEDSLFPLTDRQKNIEECTRIVARGAEVPSGIEEDVDTIDPLTVTYCLKDRAINVVLQGKTEPAKSWDELTPFQRRLCLHSYGPPVSVARLSVPGEEQGKRDQAAGAVAAAGGAGAEVKTTTEDGKVTTTPPAQEVQPLAPSDEEKRREYRQLYGGERVAVYPILSKDPSIEKSTVLSMTYPDGTTFPIAISGGTYLGGMGVQTGRTTFTIAGKGAGGLTGSGGNGLGGGSTARVNKKPEGFDVQAESTENGDLQVTLDTEQNAKKGVVSLTVEDPATPTKKKEIKFMVVPEEKQATEVAAPAGRTTAEKVSVIILLVLLVSSAIIYTLYMKTKPEEEVEAAQAPEEGGEETPEEELGEEASETTPYPEEGEVGEEKPESEMPEEDEGANY